MTFYSQLEVERKLYTLAIAALALSSTIVLVAWGPLSTQTFVTMSRAIGSPRAVAIGEVAFRQLLTALICVVPLKLTRHRLSVLDGLLVGLAVSVPTLVLFCDPAAWELATVAMGPLVFMLVFRALRSAPPSSWLDGFYSDQKPWMSLAFTAMFASQISMACFLASGSPNLLRPSIAIALIGAVLALLARRFDRVPLRIAATGVFAYDLSLYVSGWPKLVAVVFEPVSCSDL